MLLCYVVTQLCCYVVMLRYVVTLLRCYVVMSCYVMSCHVMLCCYAMLCNFLLCYVMLCYVMLCYVMLCYVLLCHVMLCYVVLCFIYAISCDEMIMLIFDKTIHTNFCISLCFSLSNPYYILDHHESLRRLFRNIFVRNMATLGVFYKQFFYPD